MRKTKVTKKERAYLKENYPKMERQDIADNLGWSLNHLVYIAKILHLHQSPEFLSKSRRERFRPHLNAEEEQYFRDNYPSTTNKVLSERYGVSMCIIKNMAKERGLRKSAEHIRECCLRALENGRTTNIINGWPPKGYRVPNGGFKKGVTNIKRLGPEKDAERIRKISEGRKRGIKRESTHIVRPFSKDTDAFGMPT